MQGYTDSVGSEDVNFKLSIKRALAVKKVILEHKGLSIEVEGKGMNLPIANNETEAGRQLNRRVEVYLNE
ncbi:OmpA family protein [Marinospirillum insulare]|uniref:OmpA family protein n=1 Tax=Marinospirillum insulare TaxID=217169 RepID=UPI000A0505CD|nr:OmpA family protein [Marinospirillum insulare]